MYLPRSMETGNSIFGWILFSLNWSNFNSSLVRSEPCTAMQKAVALTSGCLLIQCFLWKQMLSYETKKAGIQYMYHIQIGHCILPMSLGVSLIAEGP